MSNPISTVLVTGANRGIGLEFARQYLLEGWRVIGACRAPEQARALAALAAQSSGALKLVALEVTDASSVRHAAQALHAQPIDLLLHCAAVMGGAAQNLDQIDYAEWSRVLEVNTLGAVRVLEAFRAHLERSTGRLAVSLTSLMGSIGANTSGGWIAYRSSKAALNMAIRCAAIELAARRITCVLMHPGWVRTDMGGAQAPLAVHESVASMRRVIAGLGPADNGAFLDHDGRRLPW